MPPSAVAAVPAPRRVGRGINNNNKNDDDDDDNSSSNKKGLPKRCISHKFRAQDFVRKRQNESLCDHYTLGKLLGEGQFGEVFVGTVGRGVKTNSNSSNNKGDYRAIKRIAKDLLTEADHDEVFNEFFVLKQMDHPNICKMYEFFEDPDDFWFVQELCSGGELLDELERIENFTEATAGLIMKQVLSSVHYCHSQKQVVHRDLKLENILLEGETSTSTTNNTNDSYNPMIVKVIDFGLATTFTDDQILTSPVGSMHYIAPEVLEQEYRGGTCDIWSCGVIAYILLCGWAPFDAANDRDMRELIMMGHISFDDPIWQNEVSTEARDFVSYLLTYEPDKRPDAAAALRHPWIQNASKEHLQQFKATKSGTDSATKFLTNCRQFEATSKLKQATCAFMTSQLVLSTTTTTTGAGQEEGDDDSSAAHNNNNSSATATMIGEIFRAMDVDYDGRLSRDELRMGYQDFFGDHSPSLEEVDDIFDRMDLSSTGYIDYSEFVIACMGLHNQDQPHHQQLLQQAFERLLDKDGSGFISHDKLRNEMTPFYGEDVEEATIQKIIDQADADKDGQISWGDFQAMMCKTADFVPPENPTPLIMMRQKVESTESAPAPAPAPVEDDAGCNAVGDAEEDAKSEADADTKETPAENAPPVEPKPFAAGKEATTKTTTIIPGLRKRTSVGPKARLISAMYEKNLEKNRQMGVDGFEYIRKQPERSGPKRRLPRTRRVNFEELMKKPTTQIDFDVRKQREGRSKEIEHFKTTTGKARERRATIMTMFAQEKTDGKGRDVRLQELETVKVFNNTKNRRESIPHSRNSTALMVEHQKRERQREELQRVKKSLKDVSSSRKQLFESWDEANVRASIAEKRASRIETMFKELKNFHDMVPEEEELVEKSVEVANRRASVPMDFKVRERTRSRRWTRHLSGKSMTRESIENNKTGGSEPVRRMGRSASQTDLNISEEQENRLIGMQPHGETKTSAHLIEPLRRLNSFDSQQEDEGRDRRLDEMLDETDLPPLEVTLTEAEHAAQPQYEDPGPGSNSTVDMVAAQREARFNELHNAKAGAKTLRARRNTTVEMAAAQRRARLAELKNVESGKAKDTRETFEGSTQGDQPSTIVPKAKLKKSKTTGADQPSTIVPKAKLKKAKTTGADQPSTIVPKAKLKKSKITGEDQPSRKGPKVKKKKRNTIGSSTNDSLSLCKKNDQMHVDQAPGKEDLEVKPDGGLQVGKAPGEEGDIENAQVEPDGDMQVDNVPGEEGDLLQKAKVAPDGNSNENSMVELNAPCLDSSFDGSIDLSAHPIAEEEVLPDISSPDIVKPKLQFERSAPELRHSPVVEYYERPSPRDPEKDKRIRTPKNVPRMAPPKTPPNSRGKVKNRLSLKPRVGGPPLGGGNMRNRRASATATMKSTEPVLTEAQAEFLQMAKERAMESKGLSSNTPAPAEQAA